MAHVTCQAQPSVRSGAQRGRPLGLSVSFHSVCWRLLHRLHGCPLGVVTMFATPCFPESEEPARIDTFRIFRFQD